jgi:hypothetical protein
MKAILFLFSFLVACKTSFASIYITYPEELIIYEQIALQVKSELKKEGVEDVIILTANKTKEETTKDNDLTVFLGHQDNIGYEKIKGPTIFSFIKTNNIKKEKIENAKYWSIININQPIKNLLKTAEKTVKTQHKKNILFIISEKNTSTIKELESIEGSKNVKLILIKENENAAKLLEPELTNAAAIVAIYDPTIWSGNSARWILQQAYTYKVPVIGYSKAFLKAGAMASAYSSADQVIQETNKQVITWVKNKKLNNKTSYPQYTVEVNENIARALNFSRTEIIEMENSQ